MAKPLVAIVGRPNVGKSTFFNQMAGRRIAIVEDTPGVTRDRVYTDCEWQKYKFTLIDTGGIDPNSEDPLLKQMRRQAEIAIETCDVTLFLVDGKQGLTSDDQDVADLLRKSGKPVMLVVNKIDSPKSMGDVYDFYQLGMGEPVGISSVNLLNLGDLLTDGEHPCLGQRARVFGGICLCRNLQGRRVNGVRCRDVCEQSIGAHVEVQLLYHCLGDRA